METLCNSNFHFYEKQNFLFRNLYNVTWQGVVILAGTMRLGAELAIQKTYTPVFKRFSNWILMNLGLLNSSHRDESNDNNFIFLWSILPKIEMWSESDQSGYPMNHLSNRQISIRSDYLSDWSDGSSDIRMDPSSDWADGSLLSDGWVSHFFCLKRKRADIRSIRSDLINPMAHHRLKKTGLRSIRCETWIV